MSECLRCRNCAPLEPLPKGDPRRLHRGQWGLLARGLVGCAVPGPGGYQRFRSVESKDKCPLFKPEEDASRIEARYRTVNLLPPPEFQPEGSLGPSGFVVMQS